MGWALLAVALVIRPGAVVGRIDPPRTRLSPRTMIGIAACGVAVLVIATDRVFVAVSACLAAMTLLFVVSKSQTLRVQITEQRVVADYLGHLLADIHSGATLPHACAHALTELPATAPAQIRSDLALLSNHVAHGGDGADILRDSPVAELHTLGTMWSLATSHGLPIASLLGGNRDRIDKALRHRTATNAALAGPKTTAMVLAVLPIAGIGMGAMMGANPIGFLTGTPLGGILLTSGTALTCAGVLSAQYILGRASSS